MLSELKERTGVLFYCVLWCVKGHRLMQGGWECWDTPGSYKTGLRLLWLSNRGIDFDRQGHLQMGMGVFMLVYVGCNGDAAIHVNRL